MATFSQFKSKYITERRSKNIGDEGTKNIVKKLLGKDAIPDDGGRKAIIELHISKMSTKKIQINQIVEKTRGFSGAELKATCVEAGMIAAKSPL